MNPRALAPVGHQSELPQVGQMPGDVGLRRTKRVGQLADAQLFVPQEKHQTAQAGVMGQGGEQALGGYIHDAKYTINRIFQKVNL